MTPRPRTSRLRKAWREAFPHGARGQQGLTLIEAMFALSILAIGLLSLFALHQAAITAGQLSYRTSQATILAQDMMEQLVHTPYNRAASPPTNLEDNQLDQTDADNPLIDLEHFFDGGTPGNCIKVDALASTGGGGGKPMFCRTYDITVLDADPAGSGRLMIKTRVTFQMKETGKHHGVTLIETRSFDRYQ